MASNRIDKLQNRRSDTPLRAMAMDEAYASIKEDDAVKYAIGAMQPIKKTYTDVCIAEGERVKNQLANGLNRDSPVADFAYQGSVTSDTHIRVHSDIDLLTLHKAFFTIEPPGQPITPYLGDSLSDLKTLRSNSAAVLRAAFPEVSVDNSAGKAIRLTGGSLKRKIDVVVGNWWDPIPYQSTGIDYERGVSILDTKDDSRIQNKPFLHNKRIEERDDSHQGNLRKVVRLLKSLKYDADSELEISSYDLTAISYRMPDSFLSIQAGYELLLVENARRWVSYLVGDEAARSQLYVPNDTRRIFGADGVTVTGLREIHKELEELISDINFGLARSFKKLEEARIIY